MLLQTVRTVQKGVFVRGEESQSGLVHTLGALRRSEFNQNHLPAVSPMEQHIKLDNERRE